MTVTAGTASDFVTSSTVHVKPDVCVLLGCGAASLFPDVSRRRSLTDRNVGILLGHACKQNSLSGELFAVYMELSRPFF